MTNRIRHKKGEHSLEREAELLPSVHGRLRVAVRVRFARARRDHGGSGVEPAAAAPFQSIPPRGATLQPHAQQSGPNHFGELANFPGRLLARL